MVEQVTMWHSCGHLFDTKEEAEEYENEIQFEKAVESIVHSFYYRDLDEDDIVKGIIDNKDRLIEVLTK